jgi:hypothetical protein
MDMKIKILKQENILITDKTNDKEIARLSIEGSVVSGVPKGDYHTKSYGIDHFIECSGRPLNMESLGLNEMKIVRLIVSKYLKENKTGGTISYKAE